MEYFTHIVVIAGIYAILSMSLNLLVGYTGLPALGHAAFSCIGAYTSALLALQWGISPWIGILMAAALAALAGAIASFPALRLKGDYLALATLGFNIIVYGIAKNWVSLTRGPMGLPGIPPFSLAGVQLTEPWQYLFLVVPLALLTFLLLWRITTSPFGRLLKGIREDEKALRMLGVNTVKYKVEVFVVGSGIAGVAGALYAHYITFIDPSSFTIMESITILLMVIFGGMAHLLGSVIGAVALVTIPEILRFLGLPSTVAAPLRQMLYGLLLVVLMLKKPQGLLGEYRMR